MAISHSSSSHPDWAAPQIYQRDLGSGIVPGGATHLIESTVITTTTAMAQPASEPPTGRAARRRSRASRKAPTTILNTDASNFRAMVQQFTGVPTRPSRQTILPSWRGRRHSASVGTPEAPIRSITRWELTLSMYSSSSTTNSSSSMAAGISKELVERPRWKGVGGVGRVLAGGVLIISDDV
ncbi:unnamed protein product [Spirodela intermedia]|uniref:VQ domain-containing protein n=1 Tax=Spirodela intermedia TaxID=51605 RepID=A0A7I8JP38_SPIIN|nr:unnamed protein product [Spirodela intermedia]CAA6671870.1 unnamed protein product [Spirodela intermedia]